MSSEEELHKRQINAALSHDDERERAKMLYADLHNKWVSVLSGADKDTMEALWYALDCATNSDKSAWRIWGEVVGAMEARGMGAEFRARMDGSEIPFTTMIEDDEDGDVLGMGPDFA